MTLNQMKVLAVLLADSKKSDRAIAMELGISQPTVSRRRTQLVEEGYIKAFTVVPDLAKLGYDILMISEIDPMLVSKSESKSLATTIQNDKRIIGALLNSEGIYTLSRHKGIVDVEQFRTAYTTQESIIFSTALALKDFAVKTL